MHLFCVCVILHIASGIVTGLSKESYRPCKKNDYGTAKEARGPVRAVRAIKKKL
jgi:hypothetical protein